MKYLKSCSRCETSELDFVICDICGETCEEYINLRTLWGFNSRKDAELWTAEVCEDCVDKYLSPQINFNKEDGHYGINR